MSMANKSKGSSESQILEEQQLVSEEPESMFGLEDQELAKHRLRSLKDGYEDYEAVHRNYLQRHYLIIALSSVVILMGIIIAFLKFVGKESLLNSFKAIQSSFASLVSGGSIIAFGSSILYADKREAIDDTKYEPKKAAIDLCMEKDLGKLLDDTIYKLREKKDDLEIVKSWQSISATSASIFVLLLVGIDFFGFLPDIPYVDIGLDGFISIVGAYFFMGACIVNSILPDPKTRLPQHNIVIRYLVIIPCAFLVSLTKRNGTSEDCIKEVCLSPDEREEIKYLLRGLNPELISKSAKYFYKEFFPGQLSTTEKTPLLIDFIKKVDKIEPKAKQDVLNEYYRLGEALVSFLEGNNTSNKDQEIMKIVNKFNKIKILSTGTEREKKESEKIINHYIKLDGLKCGQALVEFFNKNSHLKNGLLDEEINAAHNALKVYSIFKIIGLDKIKLVRTFTPSSIGKFHRDAIVKIIREFRRSSTSVYSPNNALNA